MNKTVKWTLIGVGCLVGLAVVGMVLAAIFIDPNKYKPEIVQVVKEKTGRDLKFAGDLKLAVFPWIGVDIGGIEISNAQGFGDKPFVKVGKTSVRLQLLPLLTGQVRLGKVSVEGLNLNLAVNEQGVSNWADLVGKDEQKREKKDEKKDAAKLDLSLGGLAVKDANIIYDDLQKKKHYALRDVQVKMGSLSPGTPFDFELVFGIEMSDPQLLAKNTLTGTASLDLSARNYEVKKFKAVIDATGKALPTGKAGLTLTVAAIAVDLSGAGLIDAQGIVTKLDDSTINVNFRMTGMEKPAYAVQVKVDALDADRYLAQKIEPEKEAAAAQPAGPEADVVPVKLLKDLALDAEFQLASLKYHKMQMKDVLVKVHAADGVVDVKPAQLALYGGSIASTVNLNVQGETPRTALTAKITDVQAAGLVKDMTGKDSFAGLVNFNSALTCQGAKVSGMKRTLNGDLAFNFKDGVFPGVNLDAMALAVSKAANRNSKIEGKKEDQTRFGEISGTFKVVNGVATNRDLDVKAPHIRAAGEGAVDLNSEAVDYLVKARVVASGQGQGADTSGVADIIGLTVPVRVKGTFKNPSYGVDWAEYAKMLAQGLMKGVGGLTEGVGGLTQGLGGLLPGKSTTGATSTGKSATGSTGGSTPKKGGLMDGVKKLF
ncbi:MAG: AsmA family protein [Proteobacteria bacterium]|nr:AsmA family protein [Pseudomonadota bacterium]MBU1595862.1 AsmA family protein [Pseudomonadota bacterium]